MSGLDRLMRSLGLVLGLLVCALALGCGGAERDKAHSVSSADASTHSIAKDARPAPTASLSHSEVDVSTHHLSMDELREASDAAILRSGLNPFAVVSLVGLHRINRLERSVVRYDHWVYEEDFGSDDILKRDSHLVVLGREGDTLVGLTTQCGVNFRYPRYAYADPSEADEVPDYVAGIIALEMPGGTGRDYYLVQHETDLNNELVFAPYGRFVSEFLRPMGVTVQFWKELLESGDRAVILPVGSNDLAFVEFRKRRVLGVGVTASSEGVQVVSVSRDTPAARAGLAKGDVLIQIGQIRIAELQDVEKAADALSLAAHVDFTYRRASQLVTRRVVFASSSNAFEAGTVDSLGIESPMMIVQELLSAQAGLGALLQREFSARCEFCLHLERNAQMASPPSPAILFLRMLPLVCGLVGLAEAKRWVTHVGSAVSVVELLTTSARSHVKQLESSGQKPSQSSTLGEPLMLRPGSISVTQEGAILADVGGQPARIRLAYLRQLDDRGVAYLKEVLATIERSGRQVVAVPDGTAWAGETLCHLLAVKVHEDAGIGAGGTVDFARARLEVFVNLLLVSKGVARVKERSATQLGLSGFVHGAMEKVQSLR